MPTAAKPAATAASLATRFRVEVLGRTDFFDFAGRLAFVVLLVFDLAPARFKLVFDLMRRFDEVLDLLRFFAFFIILPVGFSSVQIGPQSGCWQADGIDFLPLYGCQNGFVDRQRLHAQEELKQERLAFAASRTVGLRSAGPIAKPEPEGGF
ncbi:MAG TPA: hypothetical protein VFP43_08375 [Mesorhizobium sp.]|nr:hypothetical protein [Mesorhizobium sp.]